MDLKNDAIPVSELKARMKEILARVSRTGAPVLVTQKGHSAVLIVGVEAYQRQQRKVEILEEIARGERELVEGKGIPHGEVLRRASAWRKKGE